MTRDRAGRVHSPIPGNACAFDASLAIARTEHCTRVPSRGRVHVLSNTQAPSDDTVTSAGTPLRSSCCRRRPAASTTSVDTPPIALVKCHDPSLFAALGVAEAAPRLHAARRGQRIEHGFDGLGTSPPRREQHRAHATPALGRRAQHELRTKRPGIACAFARRPRRAPRSRRIDAASFAALSVPKIDAAVAGPSPRPDRGIGNPVLARAAGGGDELQAHRTAARGVGDAHPGSTTRSHRATSARRRHVHRERHAVPHRDVRRPKSQAGPRVPLPATNRAATTDRRVRS